MKFKLLFFSLATICIFSLGFAQCPDSVRVYVYPEVICPGEVVHLSTDSTLLHCVNVGDIICVHSNTSDTVIVSPSDWTRLSLASSYSPLSVVFYVDETCQHGWAMATEFHTDKVWYKKSGISEDLTNIDNPRQASKDLNGFSNTLTVKNGTNYNSSNSTSYEVFNSVSLPFYIPAIGQLNILFSVRNIISTVLQHLLIDNFPVSSSWWSSTQYSPTDAWFLDTSGELKSQSKRKKATVLPVMNF